MPISSRTVPPEGPSPCDIAFVGEGPGVEEDRRRRPFIGKSGKVLWFMSRLYAGLPRSAVYIDNLMDQRHTDDRGKDRGPTEAEFAAYAPGLRRRLAQVNPKLVVTLGRFSTRAVLRRDLPMEVANGCLYHTPKGRAVIPVVHPAAGLHQPEMLAHTAHGLQMVGDYLRTRGVHGEVPAPVDQYPAPSYLLLQTTPQGPPSIKLYPDLPVAIDTEYDPVTREPWCLTFTDAEGKAAMIRADDKPALAAFRRALDFQAPTVILHNAMADLEPLRRMGIDVLAMGLKWRDTMLESFATQQHPRGLKPLASRLAGMDMLGYNEVVEPVQEKFLREFLQAALDEPEAEWCSSRSRKHSVVRRIEGMLNPVQRPGSSEAPKSLLEKWADHDNFGEVRQAIESSRGPTPRPGLDDMPKEDFLVYACRDADATLRVSRPLRQQVLAHNLGRIVDVDTGPVPLLDRMQQVGMLVDCDELAALERKVRRDLADLRIKIQIDTGIENPGSGDQVAKWAGQVGLGLNKSTKSGKRIQVDENQLILVRFKHPSVEDILSYRELDKIRGTYIEPMWRFLVGTGRYRRLHPTFRLTSAVTGRVAIGGETSIPLMGVPVRTALGKRVRDLFVAAPGNVIGSCDLSQIELRVGAGLAQDANMIQAFKDGVDLHTRTAAKFFHQDDSPAGMAKVDKRERGVIKVPNFGIFFGAREHRLEGEFLRAGISGYDLQACKDMIDWWFGEYPGVKTWIDQTWAEGAKQGFVTTDAGRRRYLPALQFDSEEYPFTRLREEAQRQATNFPVQGTAQEFEKRGMVVVHEEVIPALRNLGYCEPMLQIHDELLIEVAEDSADLCGELMVEAMTRESGWRGVPIEASWNTAATWGGLK